MSERRMAVRRQRLQQRTGAVGFFKEHFALAASASLVLLSVIRVYYFAGLSPDVALTVLSVANRTQVLVSTLLNGLVILAPLLIFLGPLRKWLLAGNETGASLSAKMRTGIVWLPLAPIVAASLSVSLLFGYTVGGLVAWLVVRRKRKKLASDPDAAGKKNNFVDKEWLLATIVGVAMMAMLSIPWQPLEKITLQSADKPVVGYVIGEQSGKTLIIEKLRQPLWTNSDDVKGRELCAKKDSWMNMTLTAHVLNLANSPQGVDCS